MSIEVITSVSEMRGRIERIIREANECLYIISPYVKVDDNEMKRLLESKRSSDDVDIRFVYRKDQDNLESIKAFLDGMFHIRKYSLNNLHAKCYLNERMALVTSLNLNSRKDNVEMGIFVEPDQDFWVRYKRRADGGQDAGVESDQDYWVRYTLDPVYKQIKTKANEIIARSEPVVSSRAGKPWLLEEEQQLDELKNSGKSDDEIAAIMGRSTNAIKIKLSGLIRW